MRPNLIELEDFSPKEIELAIKGFKKSKIRRLTGLIVAGYNCYIGRYDQYWNGEFIDYFSDTAVEDPKIFVNLGRAITRKNRLNYLCRYYMRFSLVWWIHPDILYQPLEKYQQMIYHFPGSPRGLSRH